MYNERYFFLTTNFRPRYDDDFIHIEEKIYRHIATGVLYRKRLLCNYGWGQEPGYERLPALSFEELIQLVELKPRQIGKPFWFMSTKLRKMNYICEKNSDGAISVIMQDYVEELISFLTQKVDSDYFDDKFLRRRFARFSFSTEKAREFHAFLGGVGDETFERILQKYDSWNAISQQVIEKVYQ